MKKLISKTLSLLLAGSMCLSFSGCLSFSDWWDSSSSSSSNGGNSSSGGGNSSVVTPVEQDYTITFHYGFADGATLDANGKASAYKSTMDLTSKKGKKVTVTSGMREAFAMDGYKIKGYSTTAWQKDGIEADMDVFVLYEKSGLFTITFANPDGSTISTVEKVEGASLTAAEYPAAEDVTVAEGKEFIGWDITSIDEVTKSCTITALQGNTVKFETESSHFYYEGVDKYTPVVSNFGNASGGKAVYLNKNETDPNDKMTEKAIVVMEYTIHADTDKEVYLGTSVWDRAGATDKLLSSLVTFSMKQAGATEFSIIETSATYTCTNAWGNFVDVSLGKITLKAGENVIKLIGTADGWANVDYISLKGNVDGIFMNAYSLTLGAGATFADGSSTKKVEAGGGLPVGVQTTPPAGQELVGWTDGTTTWTKSDFVMPEKDITITPIFKERKHPEATVGLTSSTIAVDGVRDAEYVKMAAISGRIGGAENNNLGAIVYMLAKDNGVYVFVDVNDNVVASRGKQFIDDAKANLDWSMRYGYVNDMIEFWFEYGDIHSKLQFDAFGYHVRSDKDGLATPFANLNGVEYKTALKGDDKLAEYVASGDPVTSNTATGYVVEFFLPLEAEGTSVNEKSMLWSLQINSVDSKDGDNVSVYGYKMKTEDEMAEVEKVNKANFEGVSVPPAKSITVEGEAANSITSDGNAENIIITGQSKASGGNYVHTANENGRNKAVLTYNFTATEDVTLSLMMAMGHRNDAFYKIDDYIKVYVNDQQISFGDKMFTIEGWWKDCDGDGKNGAGYAFEEIVAGDIQFKAGQVNTIRIETTDTRGFWEMDYFTLSGAVDGVAQVKNA